MVASLAAAQIGPPPLQRAPVNRDSVWAAALAQLTPHNTIRIHQVAGGRVEGQFASVFGTTLALAGTPAPVEYPFAALDSLWLRGKSTKTGAIIGSISFAVLGLAYGYLANEVGCKDGGDPCPEAIPLLGLAGAAGGGLVGALIGSAIPRWHRRVP